MSRRPVQDIRIYDVQDRSGRAEARQPHVVRRRVNGMERSTSFTTQTEADHYRARLLTARQDGERFDRRTGEPESWAPAGTDMQAHEWARRWLAENWAEWQPHTRTNELDGIVRFIPAIVDRRAPKPPKCLRAYLRRALPPGGETAIDPDSECERWLSRWVLTLGELDRKNLAEAHQALGLKDDGWPAKNETAKRRRRAARTCIKRAVELEYIAADPWPPLSRGQSRRKVNREVKAIDVKRLHSPETVVLVIDKLGNHRPESERWQVMTAVMYYGGLRPGEVAYLRPNDLYLPEPPEPPEEAEDTKVSEDREAAGPPEDEEHWAWGHIIVDETDDGEDNPADPKSGGRRRVPIPPRLVQLLRYWLAKHVFEPGDLIFRTRNGNRPSQSNWSRALQRAHRLAGVHHIEVYAYRHACITNWIRWGVPLAEAARRAGNSIKVLVDTYINAMEGDVRTGNACINRGLAGTRARIVLPKEEPHDQGKH